MNDEKNDLKARTKDFAIRVIRFYGSLPKSPERDQWPVITASAKTIMGAYGSGLNLANGGIVGVVILLL
jgi:hypothetical protein